METYGLRVACNKHANVEQDIGLALGKTAPWVNETDGARPTGLTCVQRNALSMPPGWLCGAVQQR
jgi:hypothetical protein